MSNAKNTKRKYVYKAGLIKRALAFGIDWYLGSVLIALPVMSLYYIVKPNDPYVMNLQNFTWLQALSVALISLMVALIYYVYIPYKTDGQTLGKKIMKLRIVAINGERLSFKGIMLRQLLGVMLIEGSLYAITPLLWQVIFYQSAHACQIITWIYYAITIISIAMVIIGKNHRAIHDHIGATIVARA
ncbi:MAG: RDD family protein [Erysipelotrichaceae bacterium]|nr:RDD family protein [Erysipelotrichaceae bacterium]